MSNEYPDTPEVQLLLHQLQDSLWFWYLPTGLNALMVAIVQADPDLRGPALWLHLEQFAWQKKLMIPPTDENEAARESSFAERYGQPLPRTGRELVQVLIDCGLVVRDGEGGAERLLIAESFPPVEERLWFTHEEQERIRVLREWIRVDEASLAIIEYLQQAGEEIPMVTLHELAVATDHDLEMVRRGLAQMVERGEVLVSVQVNQLQPHTRFAVKPDWEAIKEEWVEIRRTMDTGR